MQKPGANKRQQERVRQENQRETEVRHAERPERAGQEPPVAE